MFGGLRAWVGGRSRERAQRPRPAVAVRRPAGEGRMTTPTGMVRAPYAGGRVSPTPSFTKQDGAGGAAGTSEDAATPLPHALRRLLGEAREDLAERAAAEVDVLRAELLAAEFAVEQGYATGASHGYRLGAEHGYRLGAESAAGNDAPPSDDTGCDRAEVDAAAKHISLLQQFIAPMGAVSLAS